jgi:hypothetical protein
LLLTNGAWATSKPPQRIENAQIENLKFDIVDRVREQDID